MADTLIRDVSDTAFWVAHHRAAESSRPDALFHDPLASRLAGERGAKIAAGMPRNAMLAWSVALRTCIIDAFIEEAVAAGVDAVLNLGAGLDARPYRMQLPASLVWVEADHPQIIDYKEQVLRDERPRAQLSRVAIDLADDAARRALLSAFAAKATRALVLTEGVVPYLRQEEAAALADDLRRLPSVKYWVAEFFSPEVLAARRRQTALQDQLQNAPFRFQPDDWFAFFASHGWRSAEARNFSDEGEARGRPLELTDEMRAALANLKADPAQATEPKKTLSVGYALFEPAA